MKAAVFYEPHAPLTVEELDLDDPKQDEVRVKLMGAGVCHSDYHRVDGHSAIGNSPSVMGHEGAGIVQQVGPGVTSLAPGDHVIFGLGGTCGRCRNCTVGRPHLCERRARGGGNHARRNDAVQQGWGALLPRPCHIRGGNGSAGGLSCQDQG